MKRRSVRWSVAPLLTVAALVVTMRSVAAAPTPIAVPDQTGVQLGGTVRVSGQGWAAAAGDDVNLVVCGNDELDGSVDCEVDRTASAAVTQGGTFFAPIVIGSPPVPCPCLISVTSPKLADEVRIPIAVGGLPTATPHQRSALRRAVVVDRISVGGWGGLAGWLGGPSQRALRYRVTNTGDIVLHDPAVTITWGRGTSASGYVAAPTVGDLAPKQSKDFRTFVSLPLAAAGPYRVTVKVDPLGDVGVGRTTTMAAPWLGVAILGTLAGLVITAARRRRRHARVAVAVPGWYPDPLGAGARLWDGERWRPRTRPLAVSVLARGGRRRRVEAGWYVDPYCEDRLRLWNGGAWTTRTRPRPDLPTEEPTLVSRVG